MKQIRAITIASSASNYGKTTITLGLLRYFNQLGIAVRGAKSGPDYIDPMYHQMASGRPSVNLDAWSMPTPYLHKLLSQGDLQRANSSINTSNELVIVEGAMGAIDGAGLEGTGSVADLAASLNIPIIMVVNAAKTGHSCILPILGLQTARPELNIAGFIANRVASDRHEAQIRSASNKYNLRLFGVIRNRPELKLPSRHLGLVPTTEIQQPAKLMNTAALMVKKEIDVNAIQEAANEIQSASIDHYRSSIQPLGQIIAIAKDEAFCFCYTHLLSDWRQNGAEITFFSPLKNEAPKCDADAIYLPGGYPELYAEKLVAADVFKRGMVTAAQRGTLIYGECGGYMVLGQGIEDSSGNRHQMLGLLNHFTSFRKPKLHLGYRRLIANNSVFSGDFAGHEFHYASLTQQGSEYHLFKAEDADGNSLPNIGGVRNSIAGSFAHLICSH